MDVDVAIARDQTYAHVILDLVKPITIDPGPVMFLSALPPALTGALAETLGPSTLVGVQQAGVVRRVRPAFAIPIATRMDIAAMEC